MPLCGRSHLRTVAGPRGEVTVSEAVTAEHDLIGAVQTGPGDQDGRLRRLVLPPSLRFAKTSSASCPTRSARSTPGGGAVEERVPRITLLEAAMTETAIADHYESNMALRLFSSTIGCQGHSGGRLWSRWSRRSLD